jgi:hypothetical protein
LTDKEVDVTPIQPQDAARTALSIMVEQMKAALAADLYFSALVTGLVLPDVCGALSDEKGRASGPNYQQWMQTYMGYDAVWARHVWGYRCSLLHQGSGFRERDKTLVMFIPPERGVGQAHRCIAKGEDKLPYYAALLSVPFFVKEVEAGVDAWLNDVGATGRVLRNLGRSAYYRPSGYPPFVVGGPVVG